MSKLYSNFISRRIIALTMRLTYHFDSKKDQKICGCSLVKMEPAVYGGARGETASAATRYWALDKVFKGVSLNENDAFIDVGCGKGRILAYLIKKQYPCSITGVEFGRELAEYAQAWTGRYDNITVINDDAFALDYNRYTVVFLARPFETETFLKFRDYLESHLTHKIQFIYVYDSSDGQYLDNRPGWTLLKRDRIFISHGLMMYRSPQRYSRWIYSPTARENNGQQG